MTRIFLKTVLIASGATLLIAAGPKADLNQDGQVTKAEFTQAAQSHFYAADTNNDGFLNQDERKANKSAKRSDRKDKRFKKLDTNGDNLLSSDEMDARRADRKAKKEAKLKKALETFDTDQDGKLNKAERSAMKAGHKKKRADKKDKRGDRRANRPDANDDDLISLAEHMAVSEKLFTRMDANGDGVLTEGEGRKRKGKRGKRGKRRGR